MTTKPTRKRDMSKPSTRRKNMSKKSRKIDMTKKVFKGWIDSKLEGSLYWASDSNLKTDVYQTKNDSDETESVAVTVTIDIAKPRKKK